MSSSINWKGNKVLDPGRSYQPSQPISAPYDEEQFDSFTSVATPKQPVSPDPPLTQQGPPPSTDVGYIPNYLARNIGKNVRAEFIIGSSQYSDKTGKLIEVGVNYFVLEDVNSRTHVMCDLYSVKFVTVLQE